MACGTLFDVEPALAFCWAFPRGAGAGSERAVGCGGGGGGGGANLSGRRDGRCEVRTTLGSSAVAVIVSVAIAGGDACAIGFAGVGAIGCVGEIAAVAVVTGRAVVVLGVTAVVVGMTAVAPACTFAVAADEFVALDCTGSVSCGTAAVVEVAGGVDAA